MKITTNPDGSQVLELTDAEALVIWKRLNVTFGPVTSASSKRKVRKK
jgi:hypothetical protein